jgi:2'-5' RNA ligase
LAERVRAFVAVDVGDTVREEVARVQAALRGAAPGARWTAPELCHVTLTFLGSVELESLPAITAACRGAADENAPFELTFSGLGAFPRWRGARVLWMGVGPGLDRLRRLQASVERALLPLGFAPEPRGFSPHLTLARFKQPPDRSLAAAAGAYQGLPFGCVRVGDVRLMRSDLRPGGPVYTVLESLPLAGKG